MPHVRGAFPKWDEANTYIHTYIHVSTTFFLPFIHSFPVLEVIRHPYRQQTVIMAARNSCTHLKWSDAKEPQGGKAKGPSKNLSHKQILEQRAKQGSKFVEKNKPWTRQQIDRHMSAQERAEKDEEAAAVIAKLDAEKRERELQSRIVKPSEQARICMSELAKQLQQQLTLEESSISTSSDFEELQKIAECRQIQLDEMSALEAMLNVSDTDVFLVSDASNLGELREALDRFQEEEQGQDILSSLAEHPLLSCTLQLTIPDHRDSNDDGDLIASILLQVTLPILYPTPGSPPLLEFKYIMVTDAQEECGIDKTLASLAYLDEQGLKEAMLKEAEEMILPDPCIYELAATYLSESVFFYMHMHTHGAQAKK